MERMNFKASGDDENVKFAYQMDPTAPENIEEQLENEKVKLSKEKEIATEQDATERLEGQSNT